MECVNRTGDRLLEPTLQLAGTWRPSRSLQEGYRRSHRAGINSWSSTSNSSAPRLGGSRSGRADGGRWAGSRKKQRRTDWPAAFFFYFRGSGLKLTLEIREFRLPQRSAKAISPLCARLILRPFGQNSAFSISELFTVDSPAGGLCDPHAALW